MKSILACTTSSIKEINEDSCSIVVNNRVPFNAVIVADGIGSHTHSEIASAFVTKYFERALKEFTGIKQMNFDKLFEKAKQALIKEVNNNPRFDFSQLSKESAFSTTTICAIETQDEFIICYVGNGSAWQVRGSFNQFSANRYLPWNSINLLNPHCSEEGGKSALYRYISINDVPSSPSVISISKNHFPPGDFIMIATDGIYSYDAAIIGKDEEGKTWISGEETMELFYKKISSILSNRPLELNDHILKCELDNYMSELKEKNLMNDDCTVGVIIPEIVLKYHYDILKNKQLSE